jgi:hypothetical protein
MGGSWRPFVVVTQQGVRRHLSLGNETPVHHLFEDPGDIQVT